MFLDRKIKANGSLKPFLSLEVRFKQPRTWMRSTTIGSSPCAGVNPPRLLPLAALTGNKAAVLRARLNLLDMVVGVKITNIYMSADFRHSQSLQLKSASHLQK